MAAFGKHPGWNDHMDDLGLETEQLVALRRLLYVQGISGNVDSGAWEALAPESRLDSFHHLALWRNGDSVLLARFWSSSDGKGRKKYPMIVAAQADFLSAAWLLEHAGPILEKLESRFIAAGSAAAVREALDQARAELASCTPAEPVKTEEDVPPVIALLADRPELGPDHKGLHVLLYHMDRDLPAFLRGSRNQAAASRHLRVPACADSATAAISLWFRFFESKLDPSAMMMLLAPVRGEWVDLIVGEPAASQLFCVRAGSKVVPLTTDIPYNLDSAFIARAEQSLQRPGAGF